MCNLTPASKVFLSSNVKQSQRTRKCPNPVRRFKPLLVPSIPPRIRYRSRKTSVDSIFNCSASEWKGSCAGRNTQSCPELSRRDAIRDTIIVQGIIDMLIRTPQGLVIIDFKTDNVTPGQVRERAELYRRQLALYSRAASAILKSESIAKWLYFLTPACAFEIK